MSRTGTIAGLFAHEPEPRVMVHPEDLSRAGINEGDLVNVLSRRGHIYLQAAADPGLMRGLVFIPMHRSEEHTSELQSLTNLVCRLLLEKKRKKIWKPDYDMASLIPMSGVPGQRCDEQLLRHIALAQRAAVIEQLEYADERLKRGGTTRE